MSVTVLAKKASARLSTNRHRLSPPVQLGGSFISLWTVVQTFYFFGFKALLMRNYESSNNKKITNLLLDDYCFCCDFN